MKSTLLTLAFFFTLSIVSAQTLSVTANNDTAICVGDTITLEAIVSGGTPPYSYQWSPSVVCDTCASTLAIPLDSFTAYMVIVTDSNSVTDTAYVGVTIDTGGMVSGAGVIYIESHFTLPNWADSITFNIDTSFSQTGDWVVLWDSPGKQDTLTAFGSGFSYNESWFDACWYPVKTDLNCFVNLSACFTPTGSCQTFCKDAVIGIAEIGGSISNKDQLNTKVYPNPAQHSIVIVGLNTEAEITLYNLFSEVVMIQKYEPLRDGQMDISNLSPNIYFLHIQTQDGIAVHRIMKN